MKLTKKHQYDIGKIFGLNSEEIFRLELCYDIETKCIVVSFWVDWDNPKAKKVGEVMGK